MLLNFLVFVKRMRKKIK